MKNTLQIHVRPTEIDMLGHVNNAKYLEYFEWGREEWYKEVGISFDEMKKQGLGTVTVRICINYRKEVVLGEKLNIVTFPLRKGFKSFTLCQEIYNEKQEKVTDAEVTIAIISLEKRKGVPLPDQIVNLFQR